MIEKNVLEIKKLVSDLHCMGTYGMVELELAKIENYVKELEGKVKNLTIPVVMPRLTAKENYTENEISIITKDKEYECLLKKGDLYCIVDNTGDIEIMHESFFNGA